MKCLNFPTFLLIVIIVVLCFVDGCLSEKKPLYEQHVSYRISIMQVFIWLRKSFFREVINADSSPFVIICKNEGMGYVSVYNCVATLNLRSLLFQRSESASCEASRLSWKRIYLKWYFERERERELTIIQGLGAQLIESAYANVVSASMF